ncbi:unnamed protein product [Cladocopium goreaui]|uniref:S-antigen protein n=1 Tax=Cladocopium goreaui TaxID=2562237 RepID=A0A9P1CAA5_9DINO|nr:unnamed protein product [Cladocopium goreaui]
MLTPLERGKDLEQKVIKLRGECGNLQCQMQTLEFGHGLAKELGKYEKEFESLYHKLRRLTAGDIQEEDQYLPLVRDFLRLSKEYDAPKQAAQSMAKGIKSKRPSTGGGPAKRAKK